MSTRFTALTIREGDAFLLEDDGWNCLFDSGKDGSIVDLLEYKGINKLDLAICSHNDADHANGFIALLQSGLQIDEIWLPGLWASVLQFVKENGIGDNVIEWDDEFYYEGLESLFSEESVSCESFNQELSDWNELPRSDESTRFYERLHDKIVHHIIRSPDILFQLFASNLQNQFMGEDSNKESVVDYIEDQFDCPPYYMRRKLARYFVKGSPFFRHLYNTHLDYFIKKEWDNSNSYKRFFYELNDTLDFKLNNIIEIARLARQHGCAIRWLGPTSACTKEIIEHGHGFVALNSKIMMHIRKPKNLMAYFCMLMLTNENKYSLVFEYTKNNVPVIRFSADSNITCQSVSPYPENIIVTAPHHGSNANSNVYNQLKGNDIIWIRSDKRTNKRPCKEFKNQPNKYCLACDKFNFVSEICFEYSTWYKKWHYVRGEQCHCK